MRTDRPMRLVLMIAVVAVLLIGGASPPHAPWLLYNRTLSMPTGFYMYCGRHNQRGDIVAFVLPPAAHEYARRRGEHTDLLLLKHVLAVGGDFVSTLGSELRINGVSFGPIATVDSAGHTLPRWSCARRLHDDELVVGSPSPRSFDSRYFGPIRESQVVGAYRKLSLSPSCNLPNGERLPRAPQADRVYSTLRCTFECDSKGLKRRIRNSVGQDERRLLTPRVTAASIGSWSYKWRGCLTGEPVKCKRHRHLRLTTFTLEP